MESGEGEDTWFRAIGGGKKNIKKQTVKIVDGWTCAYSRLLNDDNPNAEFGTADSGRSSTTILAVKCENEILVGSDGRRTRKAGEVKDADFEILTGNAQKIFTIGDKYLCTISGITKYSLRLVDFLKEHAKKTSSFFELCRLAEDECDEWSRRNSNFFYPATISLIGFAYESSRSRVVFIGQNEQKDQKAIHTYSAGSGGEIAERRFQMLLKKKEVDLNDMKSVRNGIRISILQSGLECPFTGGRMNEGTVSRGKIPKLDVERPHQLSLFKLHYDKVVWPVEAYIFTSAGPTYSPEDVVTCKDFLGCIPKVKEVCILGRSRDVIYWMILTSFGFTPPPLDPNIFNTGLFKPLMLLKLDRQALEVISADFGTTNEDEW